MKRVIASLLASGALIPMFWIDAVPNGAQLCSSSVQFLSTSPAAASYAKAKLCKVVADFPM